MYIALWENVHLFSELANWNMNSWWKGCMSKPSCTWPQNAMLANVRQYDNGERYVYIYTFIVDAMMSSNLKTVLRLFSSSEFFSDSIYFFFCFLFLCGVHRPNIKIRQQTHSSHSVYVCFVCFVPIVWNSIPKNQPDIPAYGVFISLGFFEFRDNLI